MSVIGGQSLTRRSISMKKLKDELQGVPSLLRPEEVAELLGVGLRSLNRYVKQGEFPAPLKIGRQTRFTRTQVKHWIQHREGGDK